MKEMLQRRLICVSTEDTMLHTVQLMRDCNVSSVLVKNAADQVVGIITERDIVQKFTLLDMQDKLLAKAGVFMTRPIYMAHIDQLEKDVKSMFFGKGIRHFPVTSSQEPNIKSILGIMTVTDLATAWLKHAPTPQKNPQGVVLHPVAIVCEDPQTRVHYHKILEALQFNPVIEGESDVLVERACREQMPLLLDIDDTDTEKVKRYLKQLKSAHRNIFLLLSSQAQLVQPLKVHLKGEGHFIIQKPLDISYLLQLLQLTHGTKTLDPG